MSARLSPVIHVLASIIFENDASDPILTIWQILIVSPSLYLQPTLC